MCQQKMRPQVVPPQDSYKKHAAKIPNQNYPKLGSPVVLDTLKELGFSHWSKQTTPSQQTLQLVPSPTNSILLLTQRVEFPLI